MRSTPVFCFQLDNLLRYFMSCQNKPDLSFCLGRGWGRAEYVGGFEGLPFSTQPGVFGSWVWRSLWKLVRAHRVSFAEQKPFLVCVRQHSVHRVVWDWAPGPRFGRARCAEGVCPESSNT